MEEIAQKTRKHFFSFQKCDRIRKRTEYSLLHQYGTKKSTNYFYVEKRPGTNRSRLGLTVSRKVGSAVVRNRIKRLAREYFRLNRHRFSRFGDVNLIAKKKVARASSQEIFTCLEEIFIQS